MDKVKDFEVCIFEGNRKWYELLLASFFFGVTIYLLYLFIYYTFIYEFLLDQFIRCLAGFITIGSYSFVYGLRFSVSRNVLIDTKTYNIVTRYEVGCFSYDAVKKASEFEYVSFFGNNDDGFGTNLWYKTNRHFKMYSFENKESALKFALEISNKLNIDVLDATERGNFKWIDKTSI